MADFRDTLNVCGLKDLGFSGLPWTYDNRKSGGRNVKVRLDRGVATRSWLNRFFDASVTHLTSPCSDHCPLLLRVVLEQGRSAGARQAYYEIMWERDATLDERVQSAWSNGVTHGDLGVVYSALNGVLSALKSWSACHFGSVRKELERLRMQLASQQGAGMDSTDIRETIRSMNELLYREEMLWLQRSRVSWLKEGDRNTKFFHQRAARRARKNKIRQLKQADGTWTSETGCMAGMINNYFSDLYTKDPTVVLQEVTHLFDQCITDDMNDTLCKPFTEEEISNALFQIGPLIARPGRSSGKIFSEELGAP